MKRSLPKEENHRHSWPVRIVEAITRLSYPQLFLLWASIAVGFAFGYFMLASHGDVAHHGPAALVAIEDPWIRFWNAVYFSIITATSTGYGDIVPQGISKALASIQSISALFVFAVFVTKLVSYKQGLALREVHRLTFEDVFHNIREGLFIIRKDFDGIIALSKEHKKLSDEDWDTLIIAYKQCQSLISEIPDFYDEENKLYMLDARREQLLHEAVHRTLHRINTTLDTMSENGIEWIEHDGSLQELHELIRLVHSITPLWQERSPYDRTEAFEDILEINDVVLRKLEITVEE